jgi:hypothetical protein
MKLCHALAIALLIVAGCAPAEQSASSGGWFLLVPNVAADGTADTSQPLSKWQKVQTFGSQSDCNYSLTQQQFAVHGAFGPIGNAQSANQIQALQTLKGQCVAATDPRLH